MEDRAEYYSIAQAADILGVTKETLRRWDENGTMVAQRIESNNYRVYHKSQLEFLRIRSTCLKMLGMQNT
jgi:excisionase family DNA binding protein